MAGESARGTDVALERQALAAIRQLRARVEELERAQDSSVAVVGIGCRLPGAESPDAYWDLLRNGVDAVRPIPDARWDRGPTPLASLVAGRSVPAFAGLLDRVDRFDAEFFGVSPREARLLDPQQRLFLEVVWEALESGGIRPATLHGTRTGVFVGVTTTDYLARIYRTTPLSDLDAYAVTGNTTNATAGRVSFFLGANGPAITMDTACSSGLVAVDRACRSLRDGESDFAIAGGVNLLLGPEMLVSLARWGMLSPDGRCKTFDAGANGFVRAEGCGVVVLKRLADAERDGDRIFAILRGSAVNQDGASSGLSVPNGLAQQAVIRDALRAARLEPSAVGYVEAHGTGTSLGDPIELEALAAVYARGRSPEHPLQLGSVKTNLGHLEAASGLAGLLKVILALQHRTIPRQLHFATPTPHFPWETAPLSVVAEAIDWTPIDGRRIGGVSSFGFSGTNAHVIVEEAAPRASALSSSVRSAQVLTFSAKTAGALCESASRYAAALRDESMPVDGFAAAASAGRTHFGARAAVVAADRAGLVAALERIAAGETEATASITTKAGTRESAAFLFTGQGSQYVGMGLGLAAADSTFRAALHRVAAEVDRHLGRSILEVISGSAVGASIDQTAFTQPGLFTLQVALAEFWASRGVRPSTVVGHSIGELSAACVAGVLELPDAARVVVARARLMQAIPSGGAMAAIGAPVDDVATVLRSIAGVVSLAGINAPDETVISGETATVESVASHFAVRGVSVRRLTVSHPFHSPLMEQMLAEFRAAIAGLSPRQPRMRVLSTLTGQPADADFGTVEYWVRQIVAPVRYAEAVRILATLRVGAAFEIGPHPVLAGLGQRCLPDADVSWLPSLRRGHDDWTTVSQTIAAGYRRGVIDDWSGGEGAAWRSRLAVPTYPFQRTRHWVEWVDQPARVGAARGHSMLGAPVPLATDDRVYQSELDGRTRQLLDDHRIFGRPVVPGAAWVQAMLAVAREERPGGPVTIENLTFHAPLELAESGVTTVQTVVRSRTDGGLAVTCSSPANDRSWTRHASADLAPASPAVPELGELSLAGDQVGLEAWYASLERVGVAFGPSFRSIVDARSTASDVTGQIALTGSAVGHSEGWLLPPTLLDGCFQLAGIASRSERALIPARIDRLHWFREPGSSVVARARATAKGGRVLADIEIVDGAGYPIAVVEGLLCVEAETFAAPGVKAAFSAPLYRDRWVPVPMDDTGTPASGRWAILSDEDEGPARAVAAELSRQGVTVHSARLDQATELDADRIVVVATRRPVSSVESAVDQVARVSALLQRIVASEGAGPGMQVDLVTLGAQSVRSAEQPDPGLAGLWGLARSAAIEHPGLGLRRIDLGDADPSSIAVAAAALTRGTSDRKDLAVREGQLYRSEFAPVTFPVREVRLLPDSSGRLDLLRLADSDGISPAAGQIVIAVEAAGVNFRDVLCALGMFPGRVDVLGAECAGVVTAVGSNVVGFSVGDSVVALAPGAHGSQVVVPASSAYRRPVSIPVAAAAALPIAYLTAMYGLEELARLQPGERVLIHSGLGGVGLAAIHLARSIGAEVYATAGTDTRRARLRAMGLAGVYDSRSPGFREEIARDTNGRGVDVALNSLSGELIEATLATLGTDGRFLELGKRGIWTHDSVAEVRPDVRYLPFDLGAAADSDPGLLPRLFPRLFDAIAAGSLPLLPFEVHSLSSAVDAYDRMARARHVGKLVLRQDRVPVSKPVRTDGTYLVTGGLGGIGWEVVSALVRRGAGAVLVVGRREQDAEIKVRLDALGGSVQYVAADLAASDAVDRIRAALGSLPPLRGVVHAAGVLTDAPLGNQTPASFRRAAEPKLGGALVVEQVIAGQPLDFFVLFGAGAGVLGAAGQASYAAANAMLEGFAQSRSARGVPTLHIGWGRLLEVGMAARLDPAETDRLERLGVLGLAPSQAMEWLFGLIERGTDSVSVLAMDWPRYLSGTDQTALERFSLLGRRVELLEVAAAVAPVDRLRTLPPGERRHALQAEVTRAVRRVLGASEERPFDPRMALRDLGMDSLMAVELRNALARILGISLPSTLAFDFPTVADLTGYLFPVLFPDDTTIAAPVSGKVAAVAALSDDEAERALLQELESGGEGR